MELLFGTAGIPLSTRQPTTPGGIERLRELGLDCLEIQFVQGVRMGDRTALVVREAAQKHSIRLSVHAPYFVNLNAHEDDKLAASKVRLLQSARIGALCGAETVNFHAAFYLGDPPQQVYGRVKAALAQIMAQLRREGNHITMRPELMGKHSQFGTVDEVLSLSAEVEGVLPTIDFAHWHARTGKFNSYGEFIALLEQVESRLGMSALKRIHIHVSGIEYGKAGERKHLVFRESDFRYADFLRALRDKKAEGMVVCESPSLEQDALLLKETYLSL